MAFLGRARLPRISQDRWSRSRLDIVGVTVDAMNARDGFVVFVPRVAGVDPCRARRSPIVVAEQRVEDFEFVISNHALAAVARSWGAAPFAAKKNRMFIA